MEKSDHHKHFNSMNFMLSNKKGQLIYSTGEFKLFDDISEELIPAYGIKSSSVHTDYRIDNLSEEKTTLLVHAHSEGYNDYKGLGWILILRLDTDEVFAPIATLKSRILASLLFISALALFISLFFSRSITKPIDKLIKSTKDISAGKLDTQIDVKSNDEFGTLAQSFNQMVDNLITTNAVMKESEEKFRTIGSSAQDAIIMIDNNGDISFWNQAAEKIFGYAADEAIGRNLHSLIIPENNLEAFKRGFKQFQATGNGSVIGKSCEFDALRKNGETFAVELSLSSVKIQDKWNAIGIVRDITKRKQAEEDLKQRQLELSILYNVSSAVSKTIEMDKLFDIILNKLTEFETFKVEKKAGILLVEDSRMELAAHLGHPNSFLELHKNMTTADCLCGLAARTGEIIISSNSEFDCNHTIRYPGMNPHGHIIVPLKVRARVVGVLYLYTPPDVVIDENKIDILSSLGSLIGIAIDNAKLYEETKSYSLHDPLTGLSNRRMMQMVFDKSLAQAKRSNNPFSVILMDLDHFKKYNDTFGHAAGDELLVKFAKLIIRKMRQIDLAFRYGGEEFLVLLPDTDVNMAFKAAERVRKAVENDLTITVSLGVASYEKGIEREEDLIKIADKALYKAKEKGRNRVETAESYLNKLN